MRILFASMPADGHFNPLTGLAAGLAARGHDVRWYAGRQYGARLDRLGMAWFPLRRAAEVTAGNLNEHFPERAKLRGPRLVSFDLDTVFVAQVENHFADIAEIRGQWPFDALICDGALYAGHLVAESLEVPVLAVALATVVPDPQGPPPFFGLHPAKNALDKLRHAVIRRMLGRGMRTATTHYNQVLAHHGLQPISLIGFPHEPMLRMGPVLLNGVPELDFPGYQPPGGARYVGPIMPTRRALSSSTPVPDIVVRGGSKVIAVSQGTVDNTDPGKLVIPALEALKDSGHIVVATTCGAQTDALRTRFNHENIVITDFIDYEELFPHVDAFVTSGGFGSSLAAFRHGVPVVCAGTREGKNDVNARIGHNRLGIDLRTERPKPAALRAAVDAVLAEPVYAQNAARVRTAMESYDALGTVEELLRAQKVPQG